MVRLVRLQRFDRRLPDIISRPACAVGTISSLWRIRDADSLRHQPSNSPQMLLRKEVIQPQVPLRLPCYDFIPITNHTLGTYPPCGLKQRLRVQSAFMM